MLLLSLYNEKIFYSYLHFVVHVNTLIEGPRSIHILTFLSSKTIFALRQETFTGEAKQDLFSENKCFTFREYIFIYLYYPIGILFTLSISNLIIIAFYYYLIVFMLTNLPMG